MNSQAQARLAELLPEALATALAHVISAERQAWNKERELLESQARETIANLKAEIAQLKFELRSELREEIARQLKSQPTSRGTSGIPTIVGGSRARG